jgi:hypothetical protein
MKKNLIVVAIASGLTVSVAMGQGTLNFRGLDEVQFNADGNSFQLNPGAGSSATPQFTFTGADSGLTGWITGAPWAINLASLTSATGGGLTYEQASVSDGGQLNIFDGVNTLTGNLTWLEIHLLSDGQGGLADSLAVNLSGLSYAGANADLQALAADGNGNLNVTFQFSGVAPTMASLFDGTTTASFSGAISAVPEPSTLALLLLPVVFSAMRLWRKRCPTF